MYFWKNGSGFLLTNGYWCGSRVLTKLEFPTDSALGRGGINNRRGSYVMFIAGLTTMKLPNPYMELRCCSMQLYKIMSWSAWQMSTVSSELYIEYEPRVEVEVGLAGLHSACAVHVIRGIDSDGIFTSNRIQLPQIQSAILRPLQPLSVLTLY